jgi:helix-turn-helix protein
VSGSPERCRGAVGQAELDLELVDEREAATILGWSRSTLQKDRVQSRRLPFVKLGARVMYRLVDIRAFVEKNLRS